jgi:hypothetical protein
MFEFLKGKFKLLARDDSLNLKAYPGDTIEVQHTREYIDNSTGDVIRRETETVLIEKITKEVTINSAVAFEFENAFGMKQGIGGVFGEKGE